MSMAASSGCPTDGPEYPGASLALPSGRILAGGPLLRSDDRGASWTAVPQPRMTAEAVAFARLPSGRVIATGRGGVLTSDDDGESFDGVARFENKITEGVTALATPGSRQAADATGGSPSCGLTDAALCDGAAVVVIDVTRPTIEAFWTSDGGRTWSAPSPMPQPEDGIGISLVAGVVNTGVGPDGLGRAVAVLGRGVYYTTVDGGQSWQLAGRLPVTIGASDFAEYPVLGPDGHLWVMMSTAGPSHRAAVPERGAGVGAVPGRRSEAPPETGEARIRISPNPASMRASVRLSLDAPAEARIAVFDALGRHVARLHDGPLAAGEQAFALDTSALPAGVYLVRLVNGRRMESAPFTIVR